MSRKCCVTVRGAEVGRQPNRRRLWWSVVVAGTLLPLAWAGRRVAAIAATPEPAGAFGIRNTQDPKDVPIAPEELLKQVRLPPGFAIRLFAAEPDVRQPIAIDLDDRGRVWIAECYTYEGGPYDLRYDDRILIFEDRDHDGHFDVRKVFWTGPGPLTGLTIGFGGVWVLCAGELRFIPDEDGDDVPDGPPRVLLDGWEVKRVRHNIVNGLRWGPDGWLYGRHGITYPSLVGAPGTPTDRRVTVSCSIWRFHPQRHRFEIVCSGTTNPWGFDYDEHGEMFFTNNVNGHLWHAVPGAHFERMHGEDPNPYVYELMGKCADHDHWDSSAGSWQDSREGKGRHGELGGGHSHCGGMIYLGGRWPESYRNDVFMCNTHGHRVNRDRLVLRDGVYTAIHQQDFLLTGTSWFRGVELKYGPDGNVYLLDWTDLGECHDHDGVHRTSGRVYRIVWGSEPFRLMGPADLRGLSDRELARLQFHRNDWYVRHARRLLQERSLQREVDPAAVEELQSALADTKRSAAARLRAMWALYVIGRLKGTALSGLVRDRSPHVRAWAVRLLADGRRVEPKVAELLTRHAAAERSPLVCLYLASAAQRFPDAQRFEIVRLLDASEAGRNDRNQTLMLWYAIEPAVLRAAEAAIDLALEARRPTLRRLIARRIAEAYGGGTSALDGLLVRLSALDTARADVVGDCLTGILTALRGRLKLPAPPHWEAARRALRKFSEPSVRKRMLELSAIFGDGQTLAQLRRIALDRTAPPAQRRDALRALLQTGADDLQSVLERLAGDRATAAIAIRGLAAYSAPQTLRRLLGTYVWQTGAVRSAILDTACSRAEYARLLLQAIGEGKVPRDEVSAFHVRQMLSLGDAELAAAIRRQWGTLRQTSAEKRAQIAELKEWLTPKRLAAADRRLGRAVFDQLCGKCHRLFGQGAKIGPDLTGSNRKNLDYLLENVIDPAALIPKGYELHVIALDDGRVINGMIVRNSGGTLVVQTQNERLVLDADSVEAISVSDSSLMPEGQLKRLSREQIAALFAYLMGDGQVEPREGVTIGSGARGDVRRGAGGD
ncbi:MAG: dehydrogenase [Planctomycetota bacterium]|nr:MAG: dehydrogenase [Planctomycetota bacterium]